MIQKETISVTCADGVELKGMLFLPAEPKAIVQFNCGTGAKKEFYTPFLEFLAQDGYTCCLWDYRGSGESAPKNMKNCAYRFVEYGTQDMPAIKAYLQARFDLPYFIVGHSAGGQQVGFMPDLTGVRGLLAFGVSTGYMSYMPFGYGMLSRYFFYVFSPLSTAFAGFVAAKRFGIMEDLPKNVVREWRDWCERPHYFFDERFYGKSVPVGKFKEYDFPVQVYWATDDPISNARSVPAYWKHVANKAAIEITSIDPAVYQQKEIGHFGFFRKGLCETLWAEARQKLNSFLLAEAQVS